ncbi:hypothetical protein ABIA45_005086 [Bradyrhizobium sp. USDA 336]
MLTIELFGEATYATLPFFDDRDRQAFSLRLAYQPLFTTQRICLARQAEPSTLSFLPKQLLVRCLLGRNRPVRGL